MSRSTWIGVLGGAAVLLVLSRLPFLLSHPDWGVFWTEHLWIITDAAAVERGRASGAAVTLGLLDPDLYVACYHAGAAWITEAVRALGRLTGDYGVLQLKLVGLIGSVVAVCSYLYALVMVWPREPMRWAAGVYVAWLAPPTLLLWLMLMPMGHYMETWFFHALFLPPLVLILSDRASPWMLALFGVLAGLSTTYVLSNVVFVALLLVSFLLVSTRIWWGRALGAVALMGAFTATWLLTGGGRIAAAVERMGAGSLPQEDGGGLLAGWLGNVPRMVARQTLLDGDGWSLRGFFSVWDPSMGQPAVIAAVALAIAGAVACGYLLWHSLLLLSPSHRRELDLAGRVLGAQGLFLVMMLAVYVVSLPPAWSAGATNYLTLSYPAVVFGLAQGAVALCLRASGWRRGLTALPGVVLVLVLGVGWVQAASWTLRSIDRPDVQRADYRAVIPLAALALHSPDQAIVPGEVETLCRSLHEGDEAFCAAIGWQALMEESLERVLPSASELREWSEVQVDSTRAQAVGEVCAAASPEELELCAIAAGAQVSQSRTCEIRMDGPPLGPLCDGLPASARQACLTGVHRGPILHHHDVAGCSLEMLHDLCVGSGSGGSWSERACSEGVAWLATGMPVLPDRSRDPGTGACSHWPRAWQGLCEQLGTARRAGPEEQSCEQVYRSRFAVDLPERNQLIYQQCAFAGTIARDSVFPPCVIGAARVLEGLSCSWRGTELNL